MGVQYGFYNIEDYEIQVRNIHTKDEKESEESKTDQRPKLFLIQSYNYPNHFVRHKNFLGEITRLWAERDKKDATFRVVQGLADKNYISFESMNRPGYYLRHYNFRLKLQIANDDPLFKKSATFKIVPGLANSSLVSFESYNFPGYFIRHRDYHLYLESGYSDLFRKDATFKLAPPK